MAYLDVSEAFEHFKARTLEALEKQFPIEGRTRSLVLENMEVEDSLSPDDIRSQHQAKVNGETWGVPVYANLVLKDKSSGKVIDSKRVRVAELPKVTRRYSQIVNGQEYQVNNQWQLQPGAYVRRRQSGELETRFQTSGRPSFDVTFDDASKEFKMEYNKAKLPLYPILKAMGVEDDDLEKSWGKEILEANKNVRKAGSAVEQFYKSTKKAPPPSAADALKHLHETLAASRLRPDSTSITLGKPIDHVNGEALALATKKMLRVQAGQPEDDRDSILFKDLRSAGDFAFDKITAASRTIRDKASRKINSSTNVREIIKFDTLNRPILETFTKNSAAEFAKQVNPVEMLSASQQTTIMGPGGIKSEQSIMDEAKYVNPSHMAFLDPLHTPEGGKTGVTLRLPIGLRKEGHEPQVPLYNLRTKKTEYVGPRKFLEANIVMPDQVDWVDGVPKPANKKVKASLAGNEVDEIKFEDADYVMRHPSQLFNATSNLIPFLSNTSGGRASMATRHIEQAISLVDRKAPLVQVRTPSDRQGSRTFEELLGQQASHLSPVDGKVKEIKDDAIVVQGSDGKTKEIQLYKNYPLNDTKSVLDSTPLVKVGDKVKAGQVVADTNFSQKGQLALGTNLRVAYIPYKGYNFEDGVVISESAAQKLASVHLHKPDLALDKDTNINKKLFMTQHHGAFTKTQLDLIGDDGVAKIGTKVNPGDPLVLATKRSTVQDRSGLGAIRKSLGSQHANKALTWEGETAGEVVGVHKKGNQVFVHVRTVEPMQVGDKIAGRYGNKGIVTRLIPDDDMPRTKEGGHVEVLLNPSGVPGRMNVGQVLETAASKIALKTGTPYVVDNFDRADILEKVKADLKKHGVKDTEALFDPVTQQELGEALVGHQHMLKLHHQVDKKVAVRSGLNLPGDDPEKYDINLQPSGGGYRGGQAMDHLGLYALLAHGAKANIREMHTWKAEGPDPNPSPAKQWQSQHHDVWDAIQHGDPLPTPKSTFAFHKFTSMLKGAGINVEKKGHEVILTPLTDKHIMGMSGDRALTKPADLLYAKVDPKTGEPKPRPGGLFDEKLTGGHGGHKWSRIELAEPVPNPVFEGSIRILTGLSDKDYASVVNGEKAVSETGKVVEIGGGGLTGGAGIKRLLDKIDTASELKKAQKDLDTAKAAKDVDAALKRVKRLQMLDKTGIKASEAYILNHIPVLPPVMRPVSMMPDGNFEFADINQLYSSLAQNNDQLRDPTLRENLREEDRKDLRKNLYDGVSAIMGIGVPYKDAQHKGLLHQISGAQPKTGFFQHALTSRKQDMSMRSTIVPEPALGLDEVGLPREHALKLFAPFVVNQLKTSGVAANVVDAQKQVAAGTAQAFRALDKVVQDRPVLLKRDPALHKYSVQAFRPKLVAGNAIQIHPLVTGGYNADFDGDTMSVFVPISDDARREAVKMMPSNNLFSEATGRVMYQPTLESALGLYKLSRVDEDAKVKTFKTHADAVEATRTGKLSPTAPVKIGNQKTTVGRMLLATALPEDLQKDVLEKLDLKLDREGLDKLLTTVANQHKGDFGVVANKLKDIGNGASFGVVALEHSNFVGPDRLDPKKTVFVPVGTHTLSLKDFDTDKTTRDKILTDYGKRVQALGTTPALKMQKEQKIVELWSEADKAIREEHMKQHDKAPSNLLLMAQAKVKPSYDQYKQMVLAPMLVQDTSGRIMPNPIKHSYSEGLDTGEFWQQMSGARRGSVLKVQQVREPGYLSKLLMASTMDMLVTGDDCGAKNGVSLAISDDDVHDRFLAKDFSAKNVNIPAGTMLTPSVVAEMRKADKNAQVQVRSALRCEHAKGVCQKCLGLNADGQSHPIGENIGVVSAQALGERAVQLTLKEFHTGGAVSTGGGGKALVNSFERLKQLTKLPKKLPNSATIAQQSGTIEKIENDPTGAKIWIGGKAHHVSKDAAGNPLWKTGANVNWQAPKVGMKVERGDRLTDPTRTIVNPHDLYKATGSMNRVQGYLTDELYNLSKSEGVRRKSVEILVKAMSNLTKVKEGGEYDGVLRGEFHPHSRIESINRELMKSGKKPIEHEPVLKGVDMLPLSLQDDWMAKLQHQKLEQTILEAAATMGRSNIHGTHPIPGIVVGSEFGMTRANVKGKPSLAHLETVPEFAY
jgi:DNA-directed RNA polymerase subunit beta'